MTPTKPRAAARPRITRPNPATTCRSPSPTGSPACLPAFHNLALSPAYVEGWGLYAERLGEEMGVYGTDLARLGGRTKDALRCSRLVLDVGLHALAGCGGRLTRPG